MAQQPKHKQFEGAEDFSLDPLKELKAHLKREKDLNSAVNMIAAAIDTKSIHPNDIYSEIRKNHNWLNSRVVEALGMKKKLNMKMLAEGSSVPDCFIRYIVNFDLTAPSIDCAAPPIERIAPKRTEVYFWGIPASGKTCALGGIVSALASNRELVVSKEADSQGYGYMCQLESLFSGSGSESFGVFKLPEGTAAEKVFEMGMTVRKGDKDYPLTLVDLAGEIIECMHNVMAAGPNADPEEVLSPNQYHGLMQTEAILKGNNGINRKMHFFVLEYGGHAKKFKGLSQEILLQSAMNYIKKRGIFKTETDAIYILLTKADLTGTDDPALRQERLADYVRDHYMPFYKALDQICRDYEINRGQVHLLPFTIGDVCFQNLCQFNDETAQTVIDTILGRAKGFKWNKLAKTLNKLKG